MFTILSNSIMSPDGNGVGSSHGHDDGGNHSVPKEEEEREDDLTHEHRLTNQQRNFHCGKKSKNHLWGCQK